MLEHNLNPDALAELIMWKDLPKGGEPGRYVRLDSNAAHAVINLLMPALSALPAQPDTANSVEELDKLPVETVVRDRDGLVYEHDLFDLKEKFQWSQIGNAGTYPSWYIELPATILYRPVEG